MNAASEPFAAALDRSRRPAPPSPSSVRPRLTPRRKRPKRPLEATDTAAMLRRMLRAQGERVANADVEDLAELMALQADLDNAIAHAVRESRSRWGRSWADIGRAAGISRQSAQERWGKR